MTIATEYRTALRCARRLLAEGRIGTVLLELNRADRMASSCPASDAAALLSGAGYQFSAPGERRLRPASDWMRSLSDVVAGRPERNERGPA